MINAKIWTHWNAINIPVKNIEIEGDEIPAGVVLEIANEIEVHFPDFAQL